MTPKLNTVYNLLAINDIDLGRRVVKGHLIKGSYLHSHAATSIENTIVLQHMSSIIEGLICEGNIILYFQENDRVNFKEVSEDEAIEHLKRWHRKIKTLRNFK